MTEMNKMNHSQSLQSPFNVDDASQAAVWEIPLLAERAWDANGGNHFVVIPVADVDQVSMNAIRYVKVLNGEIIAVHVLINPSDRHGIQHRWKMQNIDIPLIILESPEGSIIGPLMAYVEEIRRSHKECIVTIVLPVLIGLRRRHRFLHNQTAGLIEKAFQSKEGVVIIRVPFFLTEASCKGGCTL
jgi:hypothetical protein